MSSQQDFSSPALYLKYCLSCFLCLSAIPSLSVPYRLSSVERGDVGGDEEWDKDVSSRLPLIFIERTIIIVSWFQIVLVCILQSQILISSVLHRAPASSTLPRLIISLSA